MVETKGSDFAILHLQISYSAIDRLWRCKTSDKVLNYANKIVYGVIV